jgi:cell division protein FtsB
MGETESKKADKEAAIEKLSTSIDSMSAKSAKLKQEVATLQKELAALASAQAEMDKLRAEDFLFLCPLLSAAILIWIAKACRDYEGRRLGSYQTSQL